jgi:hypothetical protein
MKTILTYIFVITCLLFVTESVNAKSVISGKLLKSTGKPLAYTEIELIPIDLDEIVVDPRLYAVSNPSGSFSFPNVPNGSYNLSINLEDQPSDLSPYSTTFFPNTAKREEARIFEIVENTRIMNLTFQLPAQLVKRKIAGKVSWKNGKPAIGAYILILDAKSESIAYSKEILRTDATGNFTASVFENRKYQILAVILDSPPPFGTALAKIKSEVFLLNQSTQPFNLTLNQI